MAVVRVLTSIFFPRHPLMGGVRIQWYAPYRDFADPPKGVRLDNCLNQQDIPRTILPT